MSTHSFQQDPPGKFERSLRGIYSKLYEDIMLDVSLMAMMRLESEGSQLTPATRRALKNHPWAKEE